jgi:F-type H+-transporting ATPase subunit b
MNINLTLFVQTIVLFLGVWVTMKYIWPPLRNALDERAKKIADGLAAADRGNKSLEDARSKIAGLEADARTKAQAIVAEGEKRAAAIVEEAKIQAKSEGDRLVEAARQEAEQAVQRAKGALRDQVAMLAVAGAEHILRREVTAETHADLLAQLKGRL